MKKRKTKKIKNQLKKNFQKRLPSNNNQGLTTTLTGFASQASQIVIFCIIAFFFLISLFVELLPKNNFELIKEQVVKDQTNYRNHLLLAEEFLKVNQLDGAKSEILISQQLINRQETNKKILGVNSWLEELKNEFNESNPEEIKKSILIWTEIATNNPQYRDAFVRLAYYYYKINDIPVAKENLEKALILDPNFRPSQELGSLMK